MTRQLGTETTVSVTVRRRPRAASGARSAVPATPADPDSTGTEVGTKFRTDVAGQVTAIRFYKAATNTGTHVGHLWTGSGSLLATVTFTGESASGWQQANLSTPVTLSPGATYVVSYYAPNGRYAGDTGYFASQGADSAPLHARGTVCDGANGVTGGAPASRPRLGVAKLMGRLGVRHRGGTPDTTPPR